MKLPEPDWDKIQAIIVRARDLQNRGLMDRPAWLELNKEFAAASHGQLEMPSALIDSGKSEWFADLHTALSERVA
jgi:hypothetical protein